MSFISRLWFPRASLLLALGGLLACPLLGATGENAPEPAKTSNFGSLRGILRPAKDLSLPSRSSGIVEKFGAVEGQQVREGDLLLQLNADVERAEVANAEAILESARADCERTKRELERTTILHSDSIGSKKDFEDAQLANLLANARQKQAVANLATARVHLADRTIVAPFSGLLFKCSRQVGEAVERLEPVMRLVDASKLNITIYAGAELLGKFKESQKAHLTIESGPARGTEPEAKVIYVDPIMDPETGTFRVKLEVPLSDTIQPGMSAILQVPTEVN